MLKNTLLTLIIATGFGLPLTIYINRTPAAAAEKPGKLELWELPEPLQAAATRLSPPTAHTPERTIKKAIIKLHPHVKTPHPETLAVTLKGPGLALHTAQFTTPTIFPELKPGRWTISVNSLYQAMQKGPIWQKTISLKDSTELEINLPCFPGATLTGRLVGQQTAKVKLTLQTPGRLHQTTANKKGQFTFTGLPSGIALLRVDSALRSTRCLEATLARGKETQLGVITLDR